MKKLKILLQSNLLCFILLIFLLCFIFYNSHINEKYDVLNGNEFTVVDFNFGNGKLFLKLNGDQKVIGNYYYDSVEEEYLMKNIKYGSRIKVSYDVVSLYNNTIPNGFNYKQYLENNNINNKISITCIDYIDNDYSFIYIIKNWLNDRIEKVDETGYIKAFILGDKSMISDKVYDSYIKCGIGHLFALSGLHVGLLSSLLIKIFKFKNAILKYIVVDVILLLYGFIVGYSASILRCIVYFIISSLLKVINIKLSSLKILYFTCVVVLFINYRFIFDVGFLYSFFTVFGIMFCKDFISGNKFVYSLKMSFVAFLFSLPVSLYCFYSINILSIIYNLFYIPFISFIVYPLSIISFVFPIFSNIFEIFICFLENSSLFFSSFDIFTIYLDFNLLEMFLFYLILFLLFKYKKYFLLLFNLFVIVLDVLIPYFDSDNYVYFFDVGQGDSSLIISSNREDVIMIDTGGIYDSSYHVSDNVISFLKSRGIYSLSNLIITHGDYDHMGDAINLVENFKVNNVIFNCGEFNKLEKDLIDLLNEKHIPYYSCIKELSIGDDKLYFLNDDDYGNENDNSSVVYTELNNYKFLFTGDAGVEVEEDLIEKYNLQDVDVLKVGHHGSKTSSGKIFIDETNPKYSIISVGKNNRYGHPNKDVLDNLNNSVIHRTDKQGSILFKIKNNKLNIKTYNP